MVDRRGELVPVYDLRARFGLGPRPLNPDERLVVVWTGSRLAAFRCDRTEWVERVDPSSIEPPDSVPGTGRHIAGVARLPDGLVLIQQLDAFLEDAEAAALDDALSARSDRAGE